jgi:hypothetical protein
MKFWVFLATLVMLLLCPVLVITASRSKPQTNDLSALSDSDLSAVTITMERTPCYGDCPSYVLTIKGNGTVQYVGRDNVSIKGTRQGTIKLEAIRSLMSEFARAGFLSISNDYSTVSCKCGFCTDMPTAITTLQVKDTNHSLTHYYGCRCAPRFLFGLETAIDKSANVEQWTGDVSKNGPFGSTCTN